MSRTLIKGDQIQITDFIKALASVNWSSDTTAPTAAAVLSKIQSEIAGVSGAMMHRGSWAQAATDTIKKGYVYVYNGSGTAPTGVTLENGDTLIANQDAASVTNANHWTIVQVNITGAITVANFLTNVVSGNTNSLTIAAGTGTNAGKIVITNKFPSISAGSAESGKYVSGISIDATTGVITVTKANLPTIPDYRQYWVLDEVPTGTINGTNRTFVTSRTIMDTNHVNIYVNGVKQHKGDDVTITKIGSGGGNTQSSDEGKASIVFDSNAYIPQEGDTVTCDYITENPIE